MDAFGDLVQTLREIEPKLRIVLFLNGRPDNYLRSQLNEYNEMNVDLMFDDNGFNSTDLVNIIKRGRLSNKKPKDRRKESGFQEYDTEERQPPKIFTAIKEKTERIKKSEPEIKPVESFVLPQCHRTIAVFNAMHGAGATYTAINLAKYFAIQNYKTCFLDWSDKPNFDKDRIGSLDVFPIGTNVDELKEEYNLIVADLGTPYEISNNGEEFKINEKYHNDNFSYIKESSLKIILGFTDEWNILKTLFFLKNETWNSIVDSSYIFIVPEGAEKIKKQCPKANVFSRNTDYKDAIFELFREEE